MEGHFHIRANKGLGVDIRLGDGRRPWDIV